MAKNNLHVVPFVNGWAVKNSRSNLATIITNKQSEAIDYAKNIAQKSNCDLIIHGRNGKVRSRDSYTNK